MLTSKQRSRLRAEANQMETIIQIGKDGIGDNLIAQVDSALNARELIKLRVLENSMLSAREAAFALSDAVGCESVQIIGTRFVLYRRNPKKGKYDELLK